MEYVCVREYPILYIQMYISYILYVWTLVGLRTFCKILGPRTCSLRTCEHAFTNTSFYRTVAHEHSEHTNMLRTCPRTCEHMLTRTLFTNMRFYRTASKTACLRTYVHLEHARTRVHEHTFTNMTNIRTYVHGETKIYIYIYGYVSFVLVHELGPRPGPDL